MLELRPREDCEMSEGGPLVVFDLTPLKSTCLKLSKINRFCIFTAFENTKLSRQIFAETASIETDKSNNEQSKCSGRHW